MLENSYKHFREKAELVKWTNYTNSELFFNCIKHEHDSDYEN